MRIATVPSRQRRRPDACALHAQHCAARGGHPQVVAALLAAGADKAHVSAEGKTALECVDADDADTAAALA
jgi:hypothetical protein